MSRLYGVVGVMGTGKTTLCQESGYDFIKTDVSGIYKKLGLDPKVEMSLDTRMDVQEEILEMHLDMWVNALNSPPFHSKPLVTDRTPLCFMTFTLAEISGYGELTDEQNDRVKRYLIRCQSALKLFEGFLYLGMSFQAPVDDSGKIRASMGYAYRQHYDVLLRGLLEDRRHYRAMSANKEVRLKTLVAMINDER